MIGFKHFILTCFNVDCRDGTGAERLSQAWLDHRFGLFERFCLPSVRGQSNADFEWLVFFDEATPGPYRERIERYALWPTFVPVFLPWWSAPVTAEAVASRLDCRVEHLITSRLDNDDAICRSYVEQVQRSFRGQALEFISFPRGYIWRERRIYSCELPNGPFASLIERVRGLKTIYGWEHAKLACAGPVRRLAGPAWIQVIHERNQQNKVRGIRKRGETLAGQFALDPELFGRSETRVSFWLDKAGSVLRTLEESCQGRRAVLLLAAITVFKLILARYWGWTMDIREAEYSAKAFLAGRDVLDPAFTHNQPSFFPMVHQLIGAGCWLLALSSGIPFAFLIKAPAILADLAVAFILRALPRGGDRAAILYLVNPVTFLLSVYHGQPHTVAAAAAVAALWLFEEGKLRGAAVALAVSASVRQHFVLLAAPLIKRMAAPGDRFRLAATLAASLLVLNFPLLASANLGRLLAPSTTYGSWGYTMLLLQLPRLAALAGFASAAVRLAVIGELLGPWTSYMNLVWTGLFLSWVAAAPDGKVRDLWRTALVYCLGMYAMTPGVGVQWLVWAVPFWLIVDRRGALIYSAFAGAFIGGSYWQWTLNPRYGVYSLTANLALVTRGELAGVLLVGVASLFTWVYATRSAWRLAFPRSQGLDVNEAIPTTIKPSTNVTARPKGNA